MGTNRVNKDKFANEEKERIQTKVDIAIHSS
jgi:hypothetical protein